VRLVVTLAVVAGLVSACGASDDGTAGATGPTFQRVESDALHYPDPVSTVTDMLAPAADGEDWRIFGSVLEPSNATSHAAVWTSDDGRGWEREDIEQADGDDSESIAAATRIGDGVLAVGQVGEEGSLDAAVWTSTGDGYTMTAPPELGGKHDQWAFDVAYGDSGIVVAGGENAWGEIRPRLWFSPDGETWSSVDGGPGGPLDTTGEESVQAVSAFNGGFVAVGWRDFEGEQDGVAWYSADGTTWEQLDAETMGGPGRQNVQSVAAVGNVLVAGGFGVDSNGLGKPVVWRSSDGRTWSERSGVLPLINNNRNAARDMSVRELTVNGDEILAAGGDDWRPHLWHSLDGGVTWVLLGDNTGVVHGSLFQDGVSLVDVGRRGNEIVAVGAEPTVLELDPDNNRWLDATGDDAFPTGGAKPAMTSVLNYEGKMLTGGYHFLSPGNGARERYTGSVWLGDPGDLTEVEPKGDAEHLLAGKVNDLSRFKGGYVAVGFEDFSLADKRTAADGEPDGLIFTSKEGDRWTRRAASLPEPNAQLISILDADPEVLAASAYDVIASQPVVSDDPAGGPGTRSLEAVAPLGDGFIAVGSVYRDADNNSATRGDFDTDPVVAVSGDGNAIKTEGTGLGGPGTQRFRDVCVRDGQALAVGVSGTDNSFDVGTRLRGRDGLWRKGETADGSFTGIEGSSQEAFGCAASAEGFVVVGSDNTRGNSDARVWFSEDGINFEQVVSGSLGGSGEQIARAAAAVPDGGWLIGGVDTIGGDSDIALWRFDDGEISRRDRDEPELGGPGTQSVAAISVVDNRAVIVGEDQVGAGMWETGDLDR
jgi:hypothetical protein